LYVPQKEALAALVEWIFRAFYGRKGHKNSILLKINAMGLHRLPQLRTPFQPVPAIDRESVTQGVAEALRVFLYAGMGSGKKSRSKISLFKWRLLNGMPACSTATAGWAKAESGSL